jgi:hypothetical protein
LDLIRNADRVFIGGIFCIVLGWTGLVPLYTWCEFSEASKLAKKEGVEVPGKATWGLILSLPFGIVQVLALVAKFSRYSTA